MRPSVAGTPGGCAGNPGGSRTPARSRSNLAGAAARPRLPARAPGGIHSEPCSPRTAADASLADSCDGLEADLPALSPYDDTCSTGGPNAGTSPADAIRVFVRVRPLSERELTAGGAAARTCVSVAQERAVVLADLARAGQEPFVASFDRVFGPKAGQGEVYAAVGAQMVHNCMAGEPRAPGWGQGGRGGAGRRLRTNSMRQEALRALSIACRMTRAAPASRRCPHPSALPAPLTSSLAMPILMGTCPCCSRLQLVHICLRPDGGGKDAYDHWRRVTCR